MLRFYSQTSRGQKSRSLARLLSATLKGKRDRAILGLLLGCGLRRRELTELTVDHFQRREDHWATSSGLKTDLRMRLPVLGGRGVPIGTRMRFFFSPAGIGRILACASQLPISSDNWSSGESNFRIPPSLTSAVRTAWPATRPAHSFLKFRAYPLDVLPSGFRFLDRDNPANPLIACQWRNILPFCPCHWVRNENLS